MLHLNSRGFTFDDKGGYGKDPVAEFKSMLSGACTSYNSFDHCLQTQAASSLHQVAAMCKDVQAVNVELLKQALIDEGVEPEEAINFWHSLASILSTTAAIIGDDALLAVMRKNELDLFAEYEGKVSSFEAERLLLLQQNLIPNQLRICELLGATLSSADEAIAKPANIPLNLDRADLC